MSIIAKPDRNKVSLAITLALFSGSASAELPFEFELSSLDGTAGISLYGENSGDESATSVSFAGDINGDGKYDLFIGAPKATGGAANSGKSYLLFGSKNLTDPLNLSAIDGSVGIEIRGESVFDYSGSSVSAAGDINGDGIDDLIIGAPSATSGASYSGTSYVLFGDDQGLPHPLNLADIDGENGFVLNGVGTYDESGASVSAAGDINGDGIDDLVIGAPYASGGDGNAYVVFGSDQAWVSPVNLSGLNGANGFRIDSVGVGDTLGVSVSGNADINGDGIDDLIIGATLAGTEGAYNGACYVVFGSDEAWASSFSLSGLDGDNGFVLSGGNAGDEAGASVSAAGDLNADGIDDLIVGAPKADPNGESSGAIYVVFGSDQVWTTPVSLSALDGSDGFVLNGVSAGDRAGTSVSAAGHVNKDKINDVIIGAPAADPNGESSGASYVVFGTHGEWPASIELSGLSADNGLIINGVSVGDNSGGSVGSAGDINFDGLSDIVIGARLADPNGDSSGAAYVIYGEGLSDTAAIFSDGFE